jgi:hypothetical protein
VDDQRVERQSEHGLRHQVTSGGGSPHRGALN